MRPDPLYSSGTVDFRKDLQERRGHWHAFCYIGHGGFTHSHSRRYFCLAMFTGPANRVLAVVLLLLCSISCTTERQLTVEERGKLDPELQGILSGARADTLTPSTFRPDGSREYSVIVYGKDPVNPQRRGFRIQTILGEMMTATVTIEELIKLAAEPSVRSITLGKRKHPI
jgi:hypothetical protein